MAGRNKRTTKATKNVCFLCKGTQRVPVNVAMTFLSLTNPED